MVTRAFKAVTAILVANETSSSTRARSWRWVRRGAVGTQSESLTRVLGADSENARVEVLCAW
jgi:hypothetical protein